MSKIGQYLYTSNGQKLRLLKIEFIFRNWMKSLNPPESGITCSARLLIFYIECNDERP